MISAYKGHYPYNQMGVTVNAPTEIGVYYCGSINPNSTLFPLYIGRAKGDGVTIRSRLSQHLAEDRWPGVTNFGYCVCSTKKEAEDFEASEILKHKPRYNTQGK